MVEAYKAALEDHLVDGINFSPEPGAKYVISRRMATFYPSGSNVYKPVSGTKLIKIDVFSDNWMDPVTSRVMFDLVNEGTTDQILYPISGPHSFFRRMRIISKGQIIEDIDDYNRLHEMFESMTAGHLRDNNMIEGFDNRFDLYDDTDDTFDHASLANNMGKGAIPEGGRKTVGFQLLSGLLNQQKYLPLRFCGFTIELELVNNFRDAVIGSSGVGASGYGTGNSSEAWRIENVQLKTDLITLAPQFEETIVEHLTSGQTLDIKYQTMISQTQTIGQDKQFSVNITRSVSALKSVFMTFYNSSNPTHATRNDKALAVYRENNLFYHPMMHNATGAYDATRELEIQMQIGSNQFPDYPIRSISESFTQLKKALGLIYSTFHSISITPKQYRTSKYIVGLDLEAVTSASFTGMNLRQGQLLTVKCKQVSNGIDNNNQMPDRLYLTMCSDNLLQVTASGIVVND